MVLLIMADTPTPKNLSKKKKAQQAKKRKKVLTKVLIFLAQFIFVQTLTAMIILYHNSEKMKQHVEALSEQEKAAFYSNESETHKFLPFWMVIFGAILCTFCMLLHMACIWIAFILPTRALFRGFTNERLRDIQDLDMDRFKLIVKFQKLLRLGDNLFSFDLTQKNKLKAALYLVNSENLKKSTECGICYKNLPNVLMEPCMHGGICSECMKQLLERDNRAKCPFCRKVSQETMY